MPQPTTTNFTEALKGTLKQTLAKRFASDILECPVCWDDINGDVIHQCGNGHLICLSCQTKLESCPVCRLKIERPIRNLALEKLLNRLIHQNNLTKLDKKGTRIKNLALQNNLTSYGQEFVRSRYVRVTCTNCSSKFLCEEGSKFSTCPRPYCKSEIEIDTQYSISNESECTDSKNQFSAPSYNRTKEFGRNHQIRNHRQLLFEKPNTSRADNLIITILSIIVTLCVIVVGITCDTVLLAVLVVFYTLRNRSILWQPIKVTSNHQILGIKFPMISQNVSNKLCCFKLCLYNFWKSFKSWYQTPSSYNC